MLGVTMERPLRISDGLTVIKTFGLTCYNPYPYMDIHGYSWITIS
jgi:hypothetical protein